MVQIWSCNKTMTPSIAANLQKNSWERKRCCNVKDFTLFGVLLWEVATKIRPKSLCNRVGDWKSYLTDSSRFLGFSFCWINSNSVICPVLFFLDCIQTISEHAKDQLIFIMSWYVKLKIEGYHDWITVCFLKTYEFKKVCRYPLLFLHTNCTAHKHSKISRMTFQL